ncbi:hypothetical protein Xvie_00341 [Xenorhabdus vietnamensis]|uniref:Phage tail collar domain-containing protein n=1 Tax=Xenorhabdus vietnamensis TaxID=351656 RepID=A0A1Y2SLQ4_9GAMM|nr:tail fiber protein [Xenorhabdus vietnamensis]OTA18513.1 hypothetical protein Xvie_00341 [Xenorhabdus vietnamensis]
MKEIRYSAKIQEQQTSSNAKGVGPETDKLKDKFKEGTIPLQIDFNELIDIADVGRKACGQSPQQKGPGAGLKLEVDGTLSLKMGTIDNQDFSPLILEKDILSVDLGSGLINKNNGISVGQGNGIVVNNNDVAVKARDATIKVESTGISVGIGWGVKIGGEGLDIKGSDGITVGTNGVAVKPYNGIISNNNGVSVKPYNGINVDGNGVSVKPYNGINADNNGVSVKAGNGITVNSSGVSIDPNNVLPRGIIVMFSGSSAPTGWAFCDGKTYNGIQVPDLRNRFIACGNTMSDTGGKSSNVLTGSKDSKTYSVTTNSGKASVSVTVNETKLTIDQLPEHHHHNGMRYYEYRGNLYGTDFDENIKNDMLMNEYGHATSVQERRPYEFRTSSVGSGQGHKHTASASDSGHTHTVNITTPYYLLAFIMKL